MYGQSIHAVPCDGCRGSGWNFHGMCAACDGTGKIVIHESRAAKRVYRALAYVVFFAAVIGAVAWILR